MQEECPKQVCTLENECPEFAFFDLCHDEGSAALLLWNSEQDKSRPVHGMLNPLAPE